MSGNDFNRLEVSNANSAESKTPSINIRSGQCLIENYLIIWVDSTIDLANGDSKAILSEFHTIVNKVIPCITIEECIKYVNENNKKTILLVSSGGLGQNLIPKIHHMAHLDSVYIFCSNENYHKVWAKNWSKIKGVHARIKPIYEALKAAAKQYNQSDVSISVIGSTNEDSNRNLNQLEPSFMYSQIFKEILLDMEYEEQAVKELVKFCRQSYEDYNIEIETIEEFARTYNSSKAIWWYTRQCFTYNMLNRALRTLDGDTIIRMGFFLRDLYRQIEDLHKKQADRFHGKTITVFRGQSLSVTDFEKLKNNQGGLISFNCFLSTTENAAVATVFLKTALKTTNFVAILFRISIDTTISSTPFAAVESESYYRGEEEILFAMHTIFRIGNVEKLAVNGSIYQVDLKLTSDDDQQLRQLTECIREEASGLTGWTRLGKMLLKVGQYKKAEELYTALLKKTPNDNERAHIYHQLGWLKDDQGEYKVAASYYEKFLEIKRKILPDDHPTFASTYSNMGSVYHNMGDHARALLFYGKANQIFERTVPVNRVALATSYNNIGLVHKSMGDYAKALQFYSKDLEITQEILLNNHPSLATSYSNIGSVYINMGNNLKALEFYEKARQIEERALPADHPSLAVSYNNIGSAYNNMGDYPKALEFYEKAHLIFTKTLSRNHPSLATSYSNIGSVYNNMGDYKKALQCFKKDLEITKKVLSSHHPSLAIAYNNIGLVYNNMGKYSKALEFYEKDLEITSKVLPANHPDLATSYNNIGLVYDNMGNHIKALSFLEKALYIRQQSLPPTHPLIKTTMDSISHIKPK